MSSLSAHVVTRSEFPNEAKDLREEATRHGIGETELAELLDAWFLEHFEPPTSLGELIHGVFC